MNDYDLLILNVYDRFDEFDDTVYYLVTDRANYFLASDQSYLRESLGILNLAGVSEGLREEILDLDPLPEFPYEKFKSASNPKVISLILG